MHWIVYVTLIFGIFLLIMGSIIVGSANGLNVDKNDRNLKNLKNTGYGVLVTGLILLISSIIALLVKHKDKFSRKNQIYSEDSISPIEMKEFAYREEPLVFEPSVNESIIPSPVFQIPQSPPSPVFQIPQPPPAPKVIAPRSLPTVRKAQIPVGGASVAIRKFPVARQVQKFGRKYRL